MSELQFWYRGHQYILDEELERIKRMTGGKSG
jgi:hypothetical protein